MANRSRVFLKNIFKQNAVPTEQNFADLIDSYYNTADDKLHLDNRGLVIGDGYKKETAPENGLLVQGKSQLGSLTIGNGVTVTAFDSAELTNSNSVVPTQGAVMAYADKKANLQGSSQVPFATQNLSVNGYFTFDTVPNGNKVKINNIASAISEDSASDEQTLLTEQAIKAGLALKANLNGDSNVNFNVGNLVASFIETDGLLIKKQDYQVINITVNNQLSFGNSIENAIDKISIDGSFADVKDTSLASQKAVKTYADTKANKTGDGQVPFATSDLTVNGQFKFAANASNAIDKISIDGSFADVKDTSLASQKAVKTYADTKANKTGDEQVPFTASDLAIKNQLKFTADTAVINKISADLNFSGANHTTLATQLAVKSYVDTKANLTGNSNVDFATNNLTLSGKFSFAQDTDTKISKISTNANLLDGTLASDQVLATQKAVKSYVDATLGGRALVGGDEAQDFQVANLTVQGQLQFGDVSAPVIDAIKTAVSTPASASALLTESAIVDYVDLKTADPTTPSDARLKTQIQDLSGCLATVLQLQGVSFEWTEAMRPSGKQFGFIAQQVEAVIPELVNTDDDGYKAIAYFKLIAFLTEAIKEQQEQINALRQDLAIISTNE
ncbi:MAG: hypothetical protein K0S11_307 [Gammaproteobacteria bacterium]|jgi:hypothetical protein|nr:hypothetical protein [Gammaproteobacteria bacterium]